MTDSPVGSARVGVTRSGAAGAGGPAVNARVVLGVGGGIAAYKVVSLLRLLTEAGHGVTVVPTESSLRFVGEATWAALSGNPVRTQVWQDVHEVGHVQLGRTADLVVIAPATADLLARAAHGRADDLLTTTLLTVRCPVLMAPAMHTEMWEHPATKANVALLRERGVQVLDPASGRLTGVDSGVGRLPEPAELFVACCQVLAAAPPSSIVPQDLVGRRVVISSGGTREPIDPVRYLGNRSSGKQGDALARRAVARGGDVRLVTASSIPPPPGVQVTYVETAAQLRNAMLAASVDADVVVMTAAVADFRPAQVVDHKIKKSADGAVPVIELVRNPDILSELVRQQVPGQVIVGFAAETGDRDGDVLTHGRAKLRGKGCDLLVVNDVSAGKVFGADTTEAVIIGRDGGERVVSSGLKTGLADAVWDAAAAMLGASAGQKLGG